MPISALPLHKFKYSCKKGERYIIEQKENLEIEDKIIACTKA